ncbi:hypothetical protein J2129_002600 [Methanofollis sp. W23]|uniref:hypothetical protein n=1 Tax=Methanofollis sp. W23 TaxID=2817849 RepID=UPI001AE4F897|nr:hypothetical protein [Methanofollis sp. W23]MBP2147146.1 hypothetical protein [Methanofollis sp. W23]
MKECQGHMVGYFGVAWMPGVLAGACAYLLTDPPFRPSMRTSHPWLLIFLTIYLVTTVSIGVVILISIWMEVQAEMISTVSLLFFSMIAPGFSALIATRVYALAKHSQRPSP